MNWNEISEKIDSLSEEYINFLVDLCNIESPTSCKEGNDKVCDLMLSKGKALGFETELFPIEIAGNIGTITMNPEGKEKNISLSAHMDTVHPIGLFGNPPVRRSDGKLYGPGVLDCKGGLAAALLAMEALSLCGYTDRPIQLILQSDEETSSRESNGKTIEYMCEKSKDSEFFLNLEGFTTKKAALVRKGIIKYRIVISGKACHASQCFTDNAANAITEAAYKILEIEKFKDPEGITCSCGIIRGGTAINSVAAECIIEVDCRFVNDEQEKYVMKKINETVNTTHVSGCTARGELVSRRPAMEYSERNEKLLERLNRSYEKCGLDILSHTMKTGGSDAAYISRLGIPCIDSLGTEGGFIHSINEFIYECSIAESAKRIAAAIIS